MRRQKGNASIVIIVVILVIIVIIVALRSQKNLTEQPTFPVIQALATTEEKEVRSLDGSQKLIMKSQRQSDGTNTYSFTIVDTNKNSEQPLFAQTLPSASSMNLPQNSWAPDNMYVFVQENADGGVHYLVFKVSREPFTSGEQYIDVAPLFAKSQPNLKLKEVTGWDGPDTLHVTTTTPEGAKGPSFWFIVSSRAFLQLAR